MKLLDKIELKPKDRKIFFDGIESDLEKMGTEFICPKCGNNVKINLTDFEKNSLLNIQHQLNTKEFTELVERMSLKEKDLGYSKTYKTKEDLSVYFSFKKCDKCETNYLVCIGFGEWQPGRYLAHVQAIFTYT